MRREVERYKMPWARTVDASVARLAATCRAKGTINLRSLFDPYANSFVLESVEYLLPPITARDLETCMPPKYINRKFL